MGQCRVVSLESQVIPIQSSAVAPLRSPCQLCAPQLAQVPVAGLCARCMALASRPRAPCGSSPQGTTALAAWRAGCYVPSQWYVLLLHYVQDALGCQAARVPY